MTNTKIESFLNRLSKNTIYWYSCFAIIIILLHLYFKINNDEGLVLAHAWSIFQGKKLYLDFFSFRPPLSFYLPAGLIFLFGPSYWVQKIFSLFLLWLAGIGIEKLGRFFVAKPFSFLPALAFLISSYNWPTINHNLFSIVVIIWALYFFFLGLTKKQKQRLFLSGSLLGVSCLFLQTRPSFVFLSILIIFIFLYHKKLKTIFLFSLLFFLPIILAALYFGPTIFFESLLLFPNQHYLSVNQTSFLPFIIFVSILFCFLPAIKNNKRLLALWLIQLFLFFSNFSRTHWLYMFLTAFPLYIIIISAIVNKKNIFIKKYQTIIALSLIALPLCVFWEALPFWQKNIINQFGYQEIVNRTKTICADEHMYAGPFLPGLYFLAQKENPTRHNDIFSGLNTPEQFEQAKKGLAEKQPSCAIVNYEIVEMFSYDQNNPLDQYLSENYESIFKDKLETMYMKRK